MLENKPRYAIGVDASADEIRDMIHRMLRLDAVQVTANWTLESDGSSDLIIRQDERHDATALPFYQVSVRGGGHTELTTLRLQRPFRLTQFLELINSAEIIFERHAEAARDHFADTSPAAQVEEPPAATPVVVDGGWLEFVNYYRNQIVTRNPGGYHIVELDSRVVAEIDFTRCSYRRSDDFVDCIGHDNAVVCHFSETPSEHGNLAGSAALPTDNLIWTAALMAGNGTELPWLEADKAFMLRRWPNFSILNHNMKMIDMASKLTKRPMTAAALAHDAEASQTQVWNFLNAASLLEGFQQVEPPQAPTGTAGPVDPDGRAETVSSLIGKLKLHLTKAA